MPNRTKPADQKWDKRNSQLFTYLPVHLKKWVEDRAHSLRKPPSQYLRELVEADYEKNKGAD